MASLRTVPRPFVRRFAVAVLLLPGSLYFAFLFPMGPERWLLVPVFVLVTVLGIGYECVRLGWRFLRSAPRTFHSPGARARYVTRKRPSSETLLAVVGNATLGVVLILVFTVLTLNVRPVAEFFRALLGDDSLLLVVPVVALYLFPLFYGIYRIGVAVDALVVAAVRELHYQRYGDAKPTDA